jgi:Tol biopolymer transport system component
VKHDVLEELRAGNPVPDVPPPPPFGPLLARLDEEPFVDRRTRSNPCSGWRRALALVPALVAVVVSIAIAGVVLTSVRHRHPAASARPGIAARNGKVAFTPGGAYGNYKQPPDFFGPTRSEHGVTWALGAVGLSNPDGSGRQNVGAYRCAEPTYACGVDSFAWSPDGTQIAYLAGHPATGNAPTSLALYLVDANGNDVRRLASCGDCSTSSFLTGFSWSPDGSRIVLTRATGQAQLTTRSNQSSASRLWLVSVKTGALHRLTDCGSGSTCADESAEWSPSGQAIVFSRWVEGHVAAIYTVRPDGTHLTLIASVAGAREPHWSPDGRKITFQANDGIYTVNADGTQLTHIVAAGPLASAPSWSPDGTTLLYQTSRVDRSMTYVWTIRADGTDIRRVYSGPSRNTFWAQSVWSPDGKQIAVGTEGGTFVMNADGTGVRRVGEASDQVAWQPIPLSRH